LVGFGIKDKENITAKIRDIKIMVPAGKANAEPTPTATKPAATQKQQKSNTTTKAPKT
jgi:hypothetical protein